MAGLAIVAAAAFAASIEPNTLMVESRAKIEYASAVPEAFGDWTLVPSVRVVVPEEADALSNRIYSQMVGRGYTDKQGNFVMLLIAYGPKQTDSLQLHRPEVCYVAEGFRVHSLHKTPLQLSPGGEPIDVYRLTAQREGRTEHIAYWMRVGDDLVAGLMSRQWAKLRYGLAGIVPDGVLVRVSTINLDPAKATEIQDRFLRDMMAAVKGGDLVYFTGAVRIRPNGAAGLPARATRS